MLGWRFDWGIRSALVLLLVLTLAPFFALEAFRAEQDVRRGSESIALRTQSQATEAAQITDDFMGFTERALASYAAAHSVRTLDSENSRAFLEGVRSQHPNYELVFLLAADGSEVAGTQANLTGLLAPHRPFLQRALIAGKMSTSEVFVLPDTDRRVVLLAYPVTSQQGGLAGVIGIALNINRLSNVIGYVQPSRNAVVLLMQRDATVIGASSDPGAWVGRTPGDRFNLPVANSVGDALVTGSMRDGAQRVMSFHQVASEPWVILAGIPQAEVNAANRETLLRIAEEFALALAAAVVLAWIVLRRVLVPIGVLSEGASDFAAGLLDRRIPLRRHDEVGHLADVLNGMAAKLQRRLAEEAEHAEALRLLNRLQTEFVATASHELRTPVTAIRAYAEALLRPDIVDESVRRSCVEGIDRTSGRLAQLARRLLDVSRIDSGQIAMELSTVDVIPVVRSAIDQASPQDGDAIELGILPGCVPVCADAERLQEVLDNLISNALNFSLPSATIRVDVEPEPSGTRITVRDAGAGITAEELPRIFDRFYQIRAAVARRPGGSGLGLYIARAYVAAMGGRLWAESRPGSGSAFFVYLPAAAEIAVRRPEGEMYAGAAPAAARR